MHRKQQSNPRKGRSFQLQVEGLELREAPTGMGPGSILSGFSVANFSVAQAGTGQSVIHPPTQQLPSNPVIHPQTQALPPGGVINAQTQALPPGGVIHQQTQTLPPGGVINPLTEALPPGGVIHQQTQDPPPGGVIHAQTAALPPGGVIHQQTGTLPPGGVINPQTSALPPGGVINPPTQALPPGGVIHTQTTTQSAAQTATSGPSTPLNDLGTGLYEGQEGGLYANGSDVRGASLEQTAESIAATIKPLDANGKVDLVNGKIVLISVGMSNTSYEFGGTNGFVTLANSQTDKNAQLVIVNGAQSGHPASDWADPNNGVWNTLLARLSAAGVTAAQVQVAWVKQAERDPENLGGFLPAAQKLQSDLEAIARNMTTHFANMKIAYMSSRTHAFTTTGLNPEPYAYESGFAVKWTIQDQINGKGNLNYDPSKGAVVAPLLLWGPYLWANGTSPRSDGFTWVRSDTGSDATHPSLSGVAKVAHMLLAFFETDPTTTSWFLKQTPASADPVVTASASQTSGASGLTVNFSASATGVNGATISSYVWTYDDGDFAYGATPTKTFYAPGTYNVHLAVVDSNGDVTLKTIAITVTGTQGSAQSSVALADVTPAGPASTLPASSVADWSNLGRSTTPAVSDGFQMATSATVPPGGVIHQQNGTLPPGGVIHAQTTALPPGGVIHQQNGTLPPGGVIHAQTTALPPGGVIHQQNGTLPPGGVIHAQTAALPPGGVINPPSQTPPPGGVIHQQNGTLPPGGVIHAQTAALPPGGVINPPSQTPPPGGVIHQQTGTAPPGGVINAQTTALPPGGVINPPSQTPPPGGVIHQQNGTAPPGGVINAQTTALPPGGVVHQQNGTLPPGGVIHQQNRTLPPGGVIHAHTTALPPGGVIHQQTRSLPPGGVIHQQNGTLPPGGVINALTAALPPGGVIIPQTQTLPPGGVIHQQTAALPPGGVIHQQTQDPPPGGVIHQHTGSTTSQLATASWMENLAASLEPELV